jgi:hypothetical protein
MAGAARARLALRAPANAVLAGDLPDALGDCNGGFLTCIQAEREHFTCTQVIAFGALIVVASRQARCEPTLVRFPLTERT